jgi:S1-C subfamily serine protease
MQPMRLIEKRPSSKPDAKSKQPVHDTIDARRLFAAIVKVQTRAIPRRAQRGALGKEREGTGIVITDSGMILTIGYLIVEVDEVKIVDSRGRTLPGRIVGYDHATGLGLVKTAVPIDARPVPLGESSSVAERDPVMIVNYKGPDDVTLAYVVSRREFTGSWEYLLDQAIFTTPPSRDWAAALISREEPKLLGVGSLIVRSAARRRTPARQHVRADRRVEASAGGPDRNGRRPARDRLGIAADEEAGGCSRNRVSPGPSDKAAQGGDIILAVAGEGAHASRVLRKVWSQGAGADIRHACCRASTSK